MSRNELIKSFVDSNLKHTQAKFEELRVLIKCNKCNKIPDEPYVLGRCDCVYCKECARSVEDCLVCGLHSFRKDKIPCKVLANVVNCYKAFQTAMQQKSACVKDTQESILELGKEHDKKIYSEPEEKKVREKPGKKMAPVSPKGSDKRSPGRTADLMKKNNKGETALHIASILGQLGKVNDLLNQGANPNVKDNAGWTPLHEATVRSHLSVVEALLGAGAHPDTPGGDSLETSLHEAALAGLVSVVELLRTHGADPSVRNIRGKTPLDYAQSEVVKVAMKKNVISKQYLAWRPAFYDAYSTLVCFHQLSKTDQKELNSLCSSLQVKTAASFSDKVTHLVVRASHGCVEASVEIYIAIAKGLWIVEESWIRESSKKNEILDPALFEVDRIAGSESKDAVARARRNSEYQMPGLFRGCNIYLHGNFQRFKKEELVNLIRQCEGTVLNRAPDPERISANERTVPFHASPDSEVFQCCHFVIFDPSFRAPEMKYKMRHIKTLPLNWLLDSVENFRLMDILKLEYII
ncbi:BRCA1-associated RING domain protein 1-like isoform X1 [Artemia franciscana]|uniref:BRCA1-associated RING domain protein 1-like isoform X1 n=1 Tax=Artemia franciscana TaxID=6661 RepID=UPI0032DAA8B4